MNLATAFAQSAEKNAGKIAVFWGDREIRYAELAAQSRQVGAHLQSRLAMKPGDLTSAESSRAADLERDRYATDAWNRSR